MAAIAHDDAADGVRPEPSCGGEPSSGAEVTQAGLDRVREGLAQVGLPVEVTQALLAVLTCAAAQHTTGTAGQTTAETARVVATEVIDDAAVLAAAHGARVLAGFAEGALVDTARTLADRAGTELLARKGLCDPAELCPRNETSGGPRPKHWSPRSCPC